MSRRIVPASSGVGVKMYSSSVDDDSRTMETSQKSILHPAKGWPGHSLRTQ